MGGEKGDSKCPGHLESLSLALRILIAALCDNVLVATHALLWLDTETFGIYVMKFRIPSGRYSLGPSGILNHVDPSVSVSNLFKHFPEAVYN